jgi:hypothetical protein
VNGSAAPKLGGGKFALDIAPLLGLAGKLAAGARAAVSQQSSLRTEYTTPRQVTSQSCVNKHITTIRGGTFVVDGVMVRAAAHSGGGTGRTCAVRSASMTSFKGTRKFRGKELDLDASIIEESRRCAREDVGLILS